MRTRWGPGERTTRGVGLTEILTESFCERCGTRYTFESTGRRRGSVTRLRVLSRSLRNLIMTDGLSVADAMAAARIDEERAASIEQLDAFHRTFNFCLGCRQYTCANCWNEAEGKCLTCAPDLAREVLPAAFPDLPAHGLTPAAPGNGHVPIEAWPTADLPRPVQAAPPIVTEVEPIAASPAAVEAIEPAGAAQPAAVATAQPFTAARIEPAPPGIAAPAAAAAAVEAEPADLEPATDGLTRDELAAVAEALVARSAAAPSVAPAVGQPAEEQYGAPAPTSASEPLSATHADPVAAGRAQTASLLHRFRPARPPRLAEDGRPAPAAEPVATSALSAAAPPVPAAPAPWKAPVDVVPQPTWRIVAPETSDTITPDTGQPPMIPPPSVPGPLLRARPALRPALRPGGSPAAPWAARLANARPVAGGVWAESSRDLLGPSGAAAPTGVQACVSCGLPLSANARFCRRCGSRQG